MAKGVLFSPEQLDLISGSPNLRRKYLNKIICFYDRDYKNKTLNYESALRKRNKVLESYQGVGDLQEELLFWNQYLEKQASYITKKRKEYLDFLNEHGKIDNKYFSVHYLKNEFNTERLKEKIHLEKKMRKTIIGPQRDDFKIMLKKNGSERNIHLFGSRSEQRLAVFWLKVNEVKFYEEYIKKRALPPTRPIILLDDVFSELDVKNKKVIFDFIKNYQTIITSTDIKILDLIEMPKSVIAL